MYECEARNSYGSDRKSVEISLEPNPQDDGIVAGSSSSSTSSSSAKSNSETTISKEQQQDESKLEEQQQQQLYHTRNINIQVLSNPQSDHVENGRVKIKCISG